MLKAAVPNFCAGRSKILFYEKGSARDNNGEASPSTRALIRSPTKYKLGTKINVTPVANNTPKANEVTMGIKN